MPLLPLVIGSSTALGISYFCADLYRNRRRLLEKPVPAANLIGYELGDIPTEKELEAMGRAVSHAAHGVTAASSECMSGGIGHCVEAIAHGLSHH